MLYGFRDLPLEVMLQVLGFVSPEDCARIRGTSKGIRIAIEDTVDREFVAWMSHAIAQSTPLARARALTAICSTFVRTLQPHGLSRGGFLPFPVTPEVDPRRLTLAAAIDMPAHPGAGSTMHVAAGYVDVSMVLALLEAGAQGDAQDRAGSTPLVWAARNANRPAVEVLLAYNAQGSERNFDDALSGAAAGGHSDIIRLLLDAGAEVAAGHQALYYAAKWGHIESLRLLLRHMDEKGLEGAVRDAAQGVLLIAVIGGCAKILPLLFENGASAHGEPGRAPLTAAIGMGRPDLVAHLLEGGALADRADDMGWGPLHLAAAQGSQPIVEQLLGHGASASAMDKQGLTASRCAERNGHRAIAAYLRAAEEREAHAHGAAPSCPTVRTPAQSRGPSLST